MFKSGPGLAIPRRINPRPCGEQKNTENAEVIMIRKALALTMGARKTMIFGGSFPKKIAAVVTGINSSY